MSDDIDRYTQDSDVLLNRADTLLSRHKTAASAAQTIPVLTEAVDASASVDTVVIPTLTDIVTSFPLSTASAANAQPAAIVTIDQALQKVSGEFKADIDAMVRTSLGEALRSPTQDASASTSARPDSPRSK